MPVIDVHNHYYPPGYIAALRSGSSSVHVTEDDEGNPVLHYPGDYNVAVRGHRDIDYRAAVLADAGVDTQVVSLTTPGTHVEEKAEAERLAKIVNDEFAEAVGAYGTRYKAYATLPLNDVSASVREFDRSINELGLSGAMLFSNVNGIALHDERFWPLYERANEAKAVLHIHPTNPVNVDQMLEFWLMPLVGFLFDTTIAAAGLVFSGVAARYPNIKWVLSHLGGAIPYLAERLDRGFEAFEECRANIDRKPSEFLRNFYYDTVNFDPRAIKLAVEFAGESHVLAGSDYPHAIGSIPKMFDALEKLDVTEAERTQILGEAAAALYG